MRNYDSKKLYPNTLKNTSFLILFGLVEVVGFKNYNYVNYSTPVKVIINYSELQMNNMSDLNLHTITDNQCVFFKFIIGEIIV